MSDVLAAAAAALGTPETLVQRSAEARAAATGSSVDDILAAWAGGAPAPAATPPKEESPAPEPTPDAEQLSTEETPSAEPAPAVAPAAATSAPPAAASAGPYKPPVLVGVKDDPRRLVVASLGLFLVVALVGLVGPSLRTDNPGARTSQIDFSTKAIAGRSVYTELGCASCHTQMVRPVIADVGLGAVTLNDTNQVPGARRFGPDLSNVGARLTSEQIRATIQGLGAHPSYALSGDDLEALVAYLSESVTAEPEDE